MHVKHIFLTPNNCQNFKEDLHKSCFTFGNPPIPRARSSFKEPVDITRARRTPKNLCRDNIDSLLNSLASCDTAMQSALALSAALTSSRVTSHSKSEASAEMLPILLLSHHLR